MMKTGWAVQSEGKRFRVYGTSPLLCNGLFMARGMGLVRLSFFTDKQSSAHTDKSHVFSYQEV